MHVFAHLYIILQNPSTAMDLSQKPQKDNTARESFQASSAQIFSESRKSERTSFREGWYDLKCKKFLIHFPFEKVVGAASPRISTKLEDL